MATHPIPVATSYVNGRTNYNDVVPGDTLELVPGTRGTLTIANVIGTAENPITIQNGDGVSDMNTTSGWVGFYLINCQHIHFTGGAYGQTYGIKITRCVGFGIFGELKTDNIEIDHVEILAVTGDGIGIRIKADATTSPNYDYDGDGDIDWDDGILNRSTYTMENVKIHDCHCNGGLGINAVSMFCYVSSSNYCEDPNQPASKNIEVYNNYIENTNHKALQVGSVISGMKIHDNILVNCDMVAAEAIAININAGIGGEVYNNWLHNCPSAGIYWQTAGGKIYNNVFIDCGRNSGTYGSAIVVDYRAGYSHSEDLQILNNTIIRPLHYGINLVDNYGVITAQNNITVSPGTDYINGTPDVESNNLETANIATVGFVDQANDDYNLAVGSVAINAGADVSAYGITFDKNSDPRPVGAYDQGAYEYQGPSVSVSASVSPSVSPSFATTGTASLSPSRSASRSASASASPSAALNIWDVDFEANDFSEVAGQVSDDCSVTVAAKLAGTNYGMSTVVNDVTGNYIYPTTLSPENTSNIWRGRFYLNPNSITIPTTTTFSPFALRGNALTLLTIDLYYFTATGYEVGGWANTDDGGIATDTYPITDAPHYIEFLLQRASTNLAGNGVLTLWIDGVLQESITTLDNYDNCASIGSFRWGAMYKVAGQTGTIYQDQLVVNDTGDLIGSLAEVSASVSPSASLSPSGSASPSSSESPSPSYAVSASLSPSASVSLSKSPSASVSISPSASPSAEVIVTSEAQYQLKIYDIYGILQYILTDFTNLYYVRRVNSPGIVQFTIRGDHPLLSNIIDKWRVEVWRKYSDTDWTLEITGIYRMLTWTYGDQSRALIFCNGIMSMLAWRIVAWTSGYTDRSKFISAKAETIANKLVKYNITTLAITANGRLRDGNINTVTVEADGAEGNTLDWFCAYDNLLETLQELAKVGGGDFDLVNTGLNNYQFRWYTGQLGTDRSTVVTFAMERGNMAVPTYSDNRTQEATTAIIGGKGEGDAREIGFQNGANYDIEFNNIEVFLNAVDVDTAAGLNTRGDQKLLELEAVKSFEFDVLQIPSCRYGEHYTLGDLVSAVNPYDGTVYTMKVNAVLISLEENGDENITVEMSEPL